MTSHHGPLLTYIVRNDQRQKLEAATQARLAASAFTDASRVPVWTYRWRTTTHADRPRHLVRQALTTLRCTVSAGTGSWRLPRVEEPEILDPRLSS